MKYPSSTLTHLRLSNADDKSYSRIINNMRGEGADNEWREKKARTSGDTSKVPQKKTGRDSIKR